MSKSTELVSLLKDVSPDPALAVCYARGTFRKEGKFLRVETGKRTLVSRALCVVEHFGAKCRRCPNSEGTICFKARG